MTKKIKVKLIIQLSESGMSRNEICRSWHISRKSAGDVLRLAKEQNIKYADIESLDEDTVYRMFFPDKHNLQDFYELPDYDYIHNELKKPKVTLKLLWKEYQLKCIEHASVPVGYTKFCDDYASYIDKYKFTSHLVHKPGVRVEVDWSGPTMSYSDKYTGEIITVYLFVATLPYSQYSYVEPTLDMKQNTWLLCNVHMLEFFGGVPNRIICDNLKTGVVSHPKEGDIILNKDYEAFAEHYLTAIMPAGVKKPKHKASVEGNVGDLGTAIIAGLRNKAFHSFGELKTAVYGKLTEYNDKDFEKREGSRTLAFQEEREYLRKLPSTPYEICEWLYGRKVQLNSHVNFKKNFYSVPYQYIHKSVDLRITATLVEVYYKGERIASDPRFPDYVQNKYFTNETHMPEESKRLEWDDIRILQWADDIGLNTREVIDRIFDSVKVKEQGYNPALSVLRLSKSPYSQERLENACELALTMTKSPRYAHLKAILSSNQDIVAVAQKENHTKIIRKTAGYHRNTNGGDRE